MVLSNKKAEKSGIHGIKYIFEKTSLVYKNKHTFIPGV